MIMIKKEIEICCPGCGNLIHTGWEEESGDSYINYCDECGIYINLYDITYKTTDDKEIKKRAKSFKLYVEENTI